MRYFDKNKHKMFPEITDWSSPQNQYRFSDNVKEMSYKHWFFFSPENFKIVTYGLPGVSMIVFLTLSILFYIKEVLFLTAVCGIIAVIQAASLYKKIKNYKITREMNLYDIWMREVGNDKVQ